MSPLGSVCLHLHAHLPFVRHPEYDDFLEEDWLYEAISETYLPLLKVYDRLTDENIPFRISMTMTPPPVAMLRDEATPRQPPKGVPVRAADLPPVRLRLVGKARRPSAAEVAANPRARSAVMRVAERV